MPSPVRALVDANVLYSNHVRNLLLQLALNGAFDIHWTAQIEDEWLRNMEPVTRQRIETRTLPLMRKHFPDAPVGGFEPSVESGRTDVKDRHVAAAARHLAPSLLVTENVRHFDEDMLRSCAVEVATADEFLVRLVDMYASNPGFIRDAVDEARRNLKQTNPSWDEYLNLLADRCRLPQFVARLRENKPVDDLSDGP